MPRMQGLHSPLLSNILFFLFMISQDQMTKLTTLAKHGAVVTPTAKGVQFRLTETTNLSAGGGATTLTALQPSPHVATAINQGKRLVVDPRDGPSG